MLGAKNAQHCGLGHVQADAVGGQIDRPAEVGAGPGEQDRAAARRAALRDWPAPALRYKSL